MKRLRVKRALLAIFLPVLMLSTSGCDAGFQSMGAAEYGVIFSALPPFMGGGVRKKVLEPGETEFLFPWQSVYRVDTSVHSISWGAQGIGDNKTIEDYVEARTLDGNEVGLAITIQYHVEPASVRYVVQRVGTSGAAVRQLVEAVARADIRTQMNNLKTSGFFSPVERQEAVDRVKTALNTRLRPEGLVIDDVIYNDHRFERRLADGTYDRSYQEQIDRTQELDQKRQQEEKKLKAIVAQKESELNTALQNVNRILQEVDGYKRQAILRGDNYLKEKQNRAEQIRAVGDAEVQGLKQQIAALSGPGGRALLRLALVKELIKRNPNFVLVNSPGAGGQGGNGIELNKLDTNELLEQLGVAVAAQEGVKDSRTKRADSKPAPEESSAAKN